MSYIGDAIDNLQEASAKCQKFAERMENVNTEYARMLEQISWSMEGHILDLQEIEERYYGVSPSLDSLGLCTRDFF